jgi:hypothetical protein
LRQGVLERLGWNIKRIWSTDWFKNPELTIQPIINELNTLKTEPQSMSVVDSVAEFVESHDAQINSQANDLSDILSLDEDLHDKLIRFDEEIIRPKYPDTPIGKRLLRPSMIEALLQFEPTSKWEFQEDIPQFIRSGTLAGEGEFLDGILQIIQESLETQNDQVATG